jgi:hypothetical protein
VKSFVFGLSSQEDPMQQLPRSATKPTITARLVLLVAIALSAVIPLGLAGSPPVEAATERRSPGRPPPS